jgi:hypothetical protein
MKGKTLYWVGITAIVGLAAWYFGKSQQTSFAPEKRPQSQDDNVHVISKKIEPESGASRKSKIDMRALIDKTMKRELPALRTPHKVDHYLDTLKQRALDNQKVTALEVESGISAISALEETLGPEETYRRIGAFTDEMSKLSKQFGHVPAPPSPPTQQELAEKLDEIATETNKIFRQEATGEYVDMIDNIEDLDIKLKLADDLKQNIVAAEEPETLPDFDALAQQISNENDNAAKQAAVRKYLAAVGQLEPDEQLKAMERLNSLTHEENSNAN